MTAKIYFCFSWLCNIIFSANSYQRTRISCKQGHSCQCCRCCWQCPCIGCSVWVCCCPFCWKTWGFAKILCWCFGNRWIPLPLHGQTICFSIAGQRWSSAAAFEWIGSLRFFPARSLQFEGLLWRSTPCLLRASLSLLREISIQNCQL